MPQITNTSVDAFLIGSPDSIQKADLRSRINAQELLVSGTNIKTINGQSLLGNTDITITGGSSSETFSTTGGAGNVPKFDANGNLYLAPLVNLAVTGTTTGTNGNLILRDAKYVGWYAADGSGIVAGAGQELARIRYDQSHGPSGEWNFDANARVCWYWNGGYQFGNANGGNHYIYFHSGYASAGTTKRQSVPLMFNSMTWNGSASVLNQMGLQVAPIDLTGTNSAFKFYRNCTAGAEQTLDGHGTKIAEIASAGVWSAGTAPTFDTLTDNPTVTQTCSIYKTTQAAKVTINGARTLVIDGTVSGMRGVIYVTQGTAGSTLALPDGSFYNNVTLSTEYNKVDRLSWEFDGLNYFWTITKGMTLPPDTSASDYITATSATDTDNINAFISGLKSLGLWATSTCWALRSNQNFGSGTTVKSFGGLGIYDGTMHGSAAWGSDGIIFDGTSTYSTPPAQEGCYIELNNPLLSTALPSLSIFSVFDSDQTKQRAIFGGFSSATTGITPQLFAGGSPNQGDGATQIFATVSSNGTNNSSNYTGATSSFGSNTGVAQTAAISASSSAITLYTNTTSYGATPARASYWNNTPKWYMGTRANTGYFFVGSQAFHMVSTTAITSDQYTALRTLYKNTLGQGLSL